MARKKRFQRKKRKNMESAQDHNSEPVEKGLDTVDDSNNRESKTKSGEQVEIKAVIIGAFFTAILSFGLGLLTDIIIHYYYPTWFNKPQVMISPHVLAYDRGTISNTIDVDTDTCYVYKAHLIDKVTGELINNKDYDFIRGDANNPGYAVISLGLHNHGNALAVIDGFYVEIGEFRPLDDVDYTLYKSGEISNPDKDVVLYASVDPLIKKTLAQPAEVSDGGVTSILDYKMLNLRLSPDEHGAYYMKIMFPRYGIYTLNISVYYNYKERYERSSTNKQICILYDGLTDDQMIDR